MKVKEKSEKILIITYMVIVGFLLLIMRLWQLQILQGKEYRKLSEANRLRIIAIPAPRGIIFDRNGIPLVKNSPYYYASLITKEFDKSKVDSVSKLLNIPAEEITEKINKNSPSPFVPIRLKEGLPFSEVAYIESRRSDFPGLIIETEVSREYIYGDVASHLIGYLGKLNPAQSKDLALKEIPPETFIGQWGVEMLFDKPLRGTLGKRVIEVDALGREIRLLQEKTPIKGRDITLSIDINLQKEAEKAFGERAGALVAIKPDTGEILGMISKPSFDPNLFAKGISYDKWMALIHDKKNPMLNRALQSQYPPGSVFKIVTAIAGLEEGVISPETRVDCRGGIDYGRWHFGCWRKHGHGVISLHRAIVESCDVFFYEVGRRLGIDKIYAYATSLGLGRKTGIELGRERQGLIPNTNWKLENKKHPWYLGETFNAAIGQGYVAVTPLQMAVMTSTIANGGNLYKPTLIKDAQPIISGKAKVRPETLEIIKKGLSGVVNESGGTGWAAKSQLTSIGGKTGTAQVVAIKRDSQSLPEKFRDHAWFVAFAPVEKPEIALSVFVEHGGHGGGTAASIAKRAIEGYMNSKNKKPEIISSLP
ncbi:MAG: penicillin-binding protein 2 [Nitrospirae bacterium CG_4_9_14_3_um_filter_41_27]|nr:MAG: penicillin-binding protein 2 [Nitrospirae bacterium CG11_big_fil_rev_8_21_14_0_20_41_14]PIV44468.1 MAG: penicillin-binding protein 2 [Nitrospirae bacterium CG02_land_8_20_14_3_00_41_53]PIW87557.1 MAG: penicillin-binding protein 2 [Nitrospirae bacterium CG_4_8_14_3_um_filter_41_47]PJA80380.1 MAG: penicillin-binding protein 2 [Nitrospirae bacterium CG_4_9_14_3_um_filter_41_27]